MLLSSSLSVCLSWSSSTVNSVGSCGQHHAGTAPRRLQPCGSRHTASAGAPAVGPCALELAWLAAVHAGAAGWPLPWPGPAAGSVDGENV